MYRSPFFTSGRIEKRKNLAVENAAGVKGGYVSENFNADNVPPCYWSLNAFSDRDFNVEHHHAFRWAKHTIPDTVKPYSVFTWPFKLSFVHTDESKAIHGNYWPDLEQRIKDFTNKFKKDDRAIDQGAMGFIPKHVDPEGFKAELALVVVGGIYVPPMRLDSAAPVPARPSEPRPAAALPASLAALPITPRQHEVLQGLLLGKPNKLIASELSISADTVKEHVQAIFRALGVNSRTQAVLAVGQMNR